MAQWSFAIYYFWNMPISQLFAFFQSAWLLLKSFETSKQIVKHFWVTFKSPCMLPYSMIIFWHSLIGFSPYVSGLCMTSISQKNMLQIADLYFYMFILLFHGSAMVNHILLLYRWYPPTTQVPSFLRANSQQRWTKPFLQTFEYHHCSGVNQKCQSTTNTQFWTKIF